MRYWIDDKTGIKMCEPNCADEWCYLIWAIGTDYDGCETVEQLKKLVDELVDMSQKARNCMDEGYIFPPKKTQK